MKSWYRDYLGYLLVGITVRGGGTVSRPAFTASSSGVSSPSACPNTTAILLLTADRETRCRAIGN